jgi:hypothetical protein
MSWTHTLNIADLPKGSYRSIAGYASESLVVGRAMLCGYIIFVKAWRDSKYDAVLDHDGTLYRIEIKQSSKIESLSVTSGGRSGEQISRDAASREEIVSTKDCDFLIGVHSMSGVCWVIPVEVIGIIGRKSINFALLESFKEKWGIFIVTPPEFGVEGLKIRLREKSIDQLRTIYSSLSLTGSPAGEVLIGRAGFTIESETDRYAYAIWEHLALQAPFTKGGEVEDND